MPQEFSIGLVLYSGKDFLILKYKPGHWGFAKGKPEKGETEKDTLRRELFEETGIKAVHLAKDFQEKEKYFFKKDGKTVYKEVKYFIGETPNKEIKLSEEHTDYKWLQFEEAMALITFRETKNVLKDLVSQDELYGFQKENSTKIYADIRTNGTSVKKKLLEEICLIAGITDIAVTQIS